MKIQIVSGFLGAGKTTFINKYISGSKDRTVIIENEFGEVGLDRKLIKGDIPVKEINSGCICCSLASDFREGIKEIITNFSPDRIIIEPSGIAQLSDILRVCDSLNREYTLKIEDRIVIVDACCFYECLESFGAFYTDQLENAGVVMFSNIDRVKNEELDRIILEIGKLNPTCTIFREDWRKLDSELLESVLSEARKNIIGKEDGSYISKTPSERKHTVAKNVFESVSLSNIKGFSATDMDMLKEKICKGDFGEVVRAKGIIPVTPDVPDRISDYWHFDSNISSFEFRHINIREFPNVDFPHEKGNVIIIGRNLEKDSIRKYFS